LEIKGGDNMVEQMVRSMTVYYKDGRTIVIEADEIVILVDNYVLRCNGKNIAVIKIDLVSEIY
jgi:hypothetical protein